MRDLHQTPHAGFETSEATVNQAVAALLIYGDLAGSEALTRALVAERTGEAERAAFWVAVYKAVTAASLS